mmetsp:Transcript_30855/g.30501  ORF Transcript_30855/g.30501 Transcript_30855/m.30501 type:complete len:365 (+) Transcript_30855:341-1435(+)
MIVDRMSIILRIFAERARTKIAKLQLELAWLKYVKTRLVRGEGNTMAGLLSAFQGKFGTGGLQEMEIVSARGRGGTGKMGGEGEKQLEIEKRQIHDREAKLKAEIERTQDLLVKKGKEGILKNYPTFAIIGYTNAGKTALMNYLTGEDLISEDLLFQTLNTTARKLSLPSGQSAVLLDTVGFITDLPHELVEAFKSTLEGVQTADVVLHIRDISHPFTELQKKAVFKVLSDINYPPEKFFKRYIEVWNKVDLIEKEFKVEDIEESPYPIVAISAKYGININKLLEACDEMGMKVMGRKKMTLTFPIEEFSMRMGWISEQLHITMPTYEVEEKRGKTFAKVEVCMDDATHQRYVANFEHYEKKRR